MFHAIVILALLIVIAKLAKTPCGCGCWRWQDCQSECCKGSATVSVTDVADAYVRSAATSIGAMLPAQVSALMPTVAATTESMMGISHGCRSRQLLTGSLANAHIPDPVTITTYNDGPNQTDAAIDPAMADASAKPASPNAALTVPAPLMPLRTITLHGSAWCTGCALIKPHWDRLRRDVPGIVYVEVDEDIAKTPGIMGYPTIIMRDPIGTVQYRGPPEYEQLRRWATAPVPYWI